MFKVPGWIKSDNSRTQTIKRNVIYSAGIKGVSIVISLLLVPLTINYVSSELYGIWLTLSSVISWLSFFDVGFGLGLRNRLTTALAHEEYAKGKIYVSTTYCILFIIFTVVGCLGFLGARMVDWCSLLNIPIEYNSELVTASQIIIVTFCATIILKLIQNVFQAYQMTAAASSVDTVGQLLSLLMIYILTKTTFPNLYNLALVFCCAPLVVYIGYSLIMYCGRFKQVAPSLRSVDFSYAKDLFSLGGQFFIIQVVCIVLYQSVNFVISHYCGPEQVTIYNVSYKYLYCAIMLFNIIMAPLWSAYNDAFAKNDVGWMKGIYTKLVKVNILVILGVLLMVLISPIVYRIWVGDKVEVPFWVSVLIGGYVICLTISTMHASILNGMGIIKIQIIQSCLQGIIFIGAIVLLGDFLDLLGILIVLIITAIIPAIILPVQVKLLLNNKAKGIWKK